jgi:hypothetical protein
MLSERAENRPMKTAAVSLITLIVVAVCSAQGVVTIEYAGIQKAQHLSGVIRDHAGLVISQVQVQEMSDNWSTVLQQTSTDGEGHWALSVLPGRRIHYIRLSKSNFNQVRFRVRIARRATNTLDIVLSVAA